MNVSKQILDGFFIFFLLTSFLFMNETNRLTKKISVDSSAQVGKDKKRSIPCLIV